MVLPTVCPRSVGLIAGIFWTKSQSPRYSPGVVGGGGPWLQKTDLDIAGVKPDPESAGVKPDPDKAGGKTRPG